MTDDLPGRFERPDPDGSFTMPDRYLGDGVYASFDGYQIWLSTVREDGITHRIALEPEVYDALHQYMQDIFVAAQNAQQKATD